MATKFELTGEKRAGKGSSISRRLRRGGRVPAVLYGGAKEPVMLTFDHDAIHHHLENEAFHTSILTVTVDGEADQAILRDVQMHPYKPKVMHMDLPAHKRDRKDCTWKFRFTCLERMWRPG